MTEDQSHAEDLGRALYVRAPKDAAQLLAQEPPETIRAVLNRLPGDFARHVAADLPRDLRPEGFDEASDLARTVTDLVEPAPVSIPAGATVGDAIARLRESEAAASVTYLYVTGADGALAGLVVMRDLLLADPAQAVDGIMLAQPFALTMDMPVTEACKAAVSRHYPVYPVVDDRNRLAGQVRGWRLFEEQVIEISAQSGKMVGVDKEERVYTPLVASFRMRHPWLQLNLVTAFMAAFVVGSFSGTIEKIVALAAFLPVLAGQSGNTGCQALAITLRGMALGDVDRFSKSRLMAREALLGLGNGLLVAVVAAIAMWVYASRMSGDGAQAMSLALVILLAMTGACIMSGISGVLIPLALRRIGADPATASAIFLTTITDIVGMGLMLVLAQALVM